jgi:hypothetical protein
MTAPVVVVFVIVSPDSLRSPSRPMVTVAPFQGDEAAAGRGSTEITRAEPTGLIVRL